MYAVEATGTANHARDLVAANGMGEVVEVIQAKMEDVELPEKVRDIHLGMCMRGLLRVWMCC